MSDTTETAMRRALMNAAFKASFEWTKPWNPIIDVVVEAHCKGAGKTERKQMWSVQRGKR